MTKLLFVACFAGCSSRPLYLPEGVADFAIADLAVAADAAVQVDAAGADLTFFCDNLQEASCDPGQGCSVIYCPDCKGSSSFWGCVGPNVTSGSCPDYCHPRGCRGDGDCAHIQWCAAPDEPACADPCQPRDCNSDSQCGGAGLICGTDPCSCSRTGCVQGCAATGCPAGQTCGTDGHCAPSDCSGQGDCPPFFVCDDTCRRRDCNSDYDCGGGYCVKGYCYAFMGTCSYRPGP